MSLTEPVFLSFLPQETNPSGVSGRRDMGRRITSRPGSWDNRDGAKGEAGGGMCDGRPPTLPIGSE